MFTEIEQQTLDIDWFFTDQINIAFAASGGGKLPSSFTKIQKNEMLVLYFRSLPEISEVIINKDLINILPHKIDKEYLADFVFMSKKGLYSFDKTNVGNFSDTNYHLVCKPTNPLKLQDLSTEIKEILINISFNKSLNQTLGINTEEFNELGCS